MFKSKEPIDFVVPSIAELNPNIAKLQARLEPLGRERSELFQESIALERERYDGAKVPEKGALSRAAELLGQAAPTFPVTREERRAQIASRMRDIDIATGALSSEISAEYRRASAVVRERAMPTYKNLIADLAGALISAHAAQVAIAGLAGKLQAEGLSSGDIGNHVPSWLGREVGPNSTVAATLRELASAGLLRDIPVELRHQ